VTEEVEVWLDADFLERMRVGTLSHDRGTLRFAPGLVVKSQDVILG